MRKNELTSLDELKSQYTGVWAPSDGHWFGLDFRYNGIEYRLHTGSMYEARECRENDNLRPLAIAFDLKEDFFNIYDENLNSKENAQAAFAKWEKSIPADSIYEDFRILAGTVHNFYEQIVNFWECPVSITNGFTECSNRLIRENNIRGRGNSFDILRSRTLYRHANLEKIEQNGMMIGPCIPQKGPVFHYEEVDDIVETVPEDEKTYYNSFDYDPMIGLIPGINFDPETGEIFDDTLFDEDDE